MDGNTSWSGSMWEYNYISKIHVVSSEQVDLFALSWYNPLPAEPSLFRRFTEIGLMPAVHQFIIGDRRKDSPSQITDLSDQKSLSFLYTFPGHIDCYSQALRSRSDHISYRYPFNIGHRNDLGQPQPKHESQDFSSNWFLFEFEQCITTWISSH